MLYIGPNLFVSFVLNFQKSQTSFAIINELVLQIKLLVIWLGLSFPVKMFSFFGIA